MRIAVNATHDPAARSWVAGSNEADGDFPLQNLPLGVFRRRGSDEAFRGGVAIGTQILDLGGVADAGLLGGAAAAAVALARGPALNALMQAGFAASSALRAALFAALRSGSALQSRLEALLVPQSAAEMTLPAVVRGYTDFYTSIHHATAVGRLFRPDQPLLPNYRWLPIAYHGRASSLGVSEQEFPRPMGQILPAGGAVPELAASRRLDYEVEVGVFIGSGNPQGTAIPVEVAEDHVFGLCLLNDWSARDLQAWEYQPLGPFLGKNFATTISPWVVTLEALAPFRLPWTRPAADPAPLPYLDDAELRRAGAFDLQLDVYLQSERMHARGLSPERLSRANFKDAYWTVAQMVAHHTVSGCNLQAGDLLGSGTQSGPESAAAGSLLELSAGGTRDLVLRSGETRRWLEDGDRVTLRARCERTGCTAIGFGDASGRVLPARV